MRLYKNGGDPPGTIYTPKEVLKPEIESGFWVVEAETEEALRVLKARGFTKDKPKELNGVRNLSSPLMETALQRWDDWREDRPLQVEEQIYSLKTAQATRRKVKLKPVPRNGWKQKYRGKVGAVGVVLTITGYGKAEEAAMNRIDAFLPQLPPGSHLVVVQNDPKKHAATKKWKPKVKKYYKLVCTKNEGFAAACNSGAAKVTKARWVLFTQSDVEWGPEAFRMAAGCSLRVKGSTKWPPAVGPSGGVVTAGRGINESGRNIGERFVPKVMDFLAGYWVLVTREALWEVGGWDDGYFLYFEDPDLCLRLAMIGCPSIVYPALSIDHGRSETITPMLGNFKHDIQAWSRRRFQRRWGR